MWRKCVELYAKEMQNKMTKYHTCTCICECVYTLMCVWVCVSHLLVTVGDVADLVPGEGALGSQPVFRLVDMQTQGIHTQEKIGSLFILAINMQCKQRILVSCPQTKHPADIFFYLINEADTLC